MNEWRLGSYLALIQEHHSSGSQVESWSLTCLINPSIILVRLATCSSSVEDLVIIACIMEEALDIAESSVGDNLDSGI